jgi:hypothetical protein
MDLEANVNIFEKHFCQKKIVAELMGLEANVNIFDQYFRREKFVAERMGLGPMLTFLKNIFAEKIRHRADGPGGQC